MLEKTSNTPLQIMYGRDSSLARTHIFGLRELIRLRGGLESLPVALARHLRK